MSDVSANISRQKRIGYVLLASAVVAFVGSVAALQHYEFPVVSYLILLVPVNILAFLGYRAVSASRDRKALGDERTGNVYGRVGINSFWILMSIILVDVAFGIFPEEIAGIAYVFGGLLIYCLYFGYYTYLE
ncbi:hypothetical protein [Natronorubrum halophilum]|uniref:hypothetical protein n=1 Tax=Natronorubrum halophilum TaxID=1702106 RepID=UPI0013CE6480|nr:hypothetical protein [Natronorubrum halophilum]